MRVNPRALTRRSAPEMRSPLPASAGLFRPDDAVMCKQGAKIYQARCTSRPGRVAGGWRDKQAGGYEVTMGDFPHHPATRVATPGTTRMMWRASALSRWLQAQNKKPPHQPRGRRFSGCGCIWALRLGAQTEISFYGPGSRGSSTGRLRCLSS